MFLLFRLDGEARSTIKMLFILYFVSGPESESESKLESESIRSPESESESESEQPHHDSAPLVKNIVKDTPLRYLFMART